MESLPVLYAGAEKKDTAAMIRALSVLKSTSEWRGRLEGILQAKGDPAVYVPRLVDQLRRLPLKARNDSPTLQAVAKSSHPQAVAFLLSALRDPKAAPAWRSRAFEALAGTGGNAGVEAVRRARPRRSWRTPWYERVQVTKLHSHATVSTRIDSRGRTWKLFYNGVLGNTSDLFVAQKQKTGWGRPLFTGAWTRRTWDREAPTAFRGIPMATLLKTQWIRLFPYDATLRRDTDRDGLTDVVEKRLGTRLDKADTDGDKFSDLVDPCPNAAPRQLGDAEKIVAACIEARFFEQDWGVPAVLEINGIKPFELYGYAPMVVWETGSSANPNTNPSARAGKQTARQQAAGRRVANHAKKHPLHQMYGGGVNVLSFHAPSDGMGRKRNSPMIQFSADRKTARTLLSRYSGGLNGDGIEISLRKVAGDWFVTGLQMRYVS